MIAGYQRYGSTLDRPHGRARPGTDHFTVAHGVWLDDDDMKRLGDRGASVAHNPGSNMRLGNGLADMRGMLDAKVNVGIGTDGANCSDNQNVYEAMRLASFASKVQGPDVERWVTTEEVLARRDRRRRPRARPRQADRPDRAGLQGRHRLPRPAPHQLDPDERSGEPAGPHRGRQRRAFGDGRRPHGGRGPQAAHRRSRPSSPPRPRSHAAPREDPAPRRSSTIGWRRWSARSAPASPRRRCTSTASAPAITIIEWTDAALPLAAVDPLVVGGATPRLELRSLDVSIWAWPGRQSARRRLLGGVAAGWWSQLDDAKSDNAAKARNAPSLLL